jgi:anaerobic selenocysteine-containing dehydrogenase
LRENRRYDERYLCNANKAAAAADNEPTWCNTTWLVKIGADGRPGAFLRASEIGLPAEQRKTASGGEWTYDPFVVLRDGVLVPLDPYDARTPVEGDLFVKTALNGISVKSALQLLYESVAERTLAEVAAITGLDAQDIIDVAREFTSHGKKRRRMSTAEPASIRTAFTMSSPGSV